MLRKVVQATFLLFLLSITHSSIFIVDSNAKTRPRCNDRRDNDGDGKIDYPRDKGCTSKSDNDEKNKRTPRPKPPQNSGELGAGASLKGRRPFPDSNTWNLDISGSSVDSRSDEIISSIGSSTGLHPDFGTVYNGTPIGIPYVVVPSTQAKVSISQFEYASESDKGPYPIPSDVPIEGGANATGDRHIIIIDRDNWLLYELFAASRTSRGWRAGSGAIFDLNTNDLRPAGWTSADAAGLPIFPGLVRWDEVYEQGEIRHALRFTVSNSRRGYVSPARHFASSSTNVNLPPMGMRVRLKASFDISEFSTPVQVILTALKKYGMMVADNGSNWFISGAPDARWNDDELHELGEVKGHDFEVVEMGEVVTD